MKSSRRSRRWAKGKRELERGWPSQWSCVGPHSDVKPCLSVPVLMRSLVGWQEGEVDVSPDVLYAPCPTPPESASVRPATPGLLPALLPRASGRWLARSLHPTLQAPPTTAGRECGSEGKAPDLLRVGAWLLAPGFHLPHAVWPLFHTGRRNPAGSWPSQSSRGGPWPLRHTCGPVPTPLPGHSSCTAATGRARAIVPGLTSRPPWRLPPRECCAPLPTAAGLDTFLLGPRAGAGS